MVPTIEELPACKLGPMKTNLARTDAQHRADLISNIHYTIEVDVTGVEQFTSRSTVAFDSKAGDTFFDLVADEFSAILSRQIDERSQAR